MLNFYSAFVIYRIQVALFISKLIIVTINLLVMTRREREILIASVSWTDKTLTVNEEKAFQAGARWADKTRLEQLLNYLEAEHPTFFDHFGEEIRKAMEE